MNRFEPLRTYVSPSARAVVRMAAESDPDPRLGQRVGREPLPHWRACGRKRSFCSFAAGQLEPERAQLLDGQDQPARGADLRDLLDRDQGRAACRCRGRRAAPRRRGRRGRARDRARRCPRGTRATRRSRQRAARCGRGRAFGRGRGSPAARRSGCRTARPECNSQFAVRRGWEPWPRLRRSADAQTAAAKVQRYLSVCCEAPLDLAASFSDGRGFLICSSCGKVLAVEPKPERERTSPGPYAGEWQTASTLFPSASSTYAP